MCIMFIMCITFMLIIMIISCVIIDLFGTRNTAAEVAVMSATVLQGGRPSRQANEQSSALKAKRANQASNQRAIQPARYGSQEDESDCAGRPRPTDARGQHFARARRCLGARVHGSAGAQAQTGVPHDRISRHVDTPACKGALGSPWSALPHTPPSARTPSLDPFGRRASWKGLRTSTTSL